MNIYVGNLSYEVTEEDLKQAFEAFGEVESVKIITDKYTNRSKGFGFVEMPSQAEAQPAIDELNGKELKGRTLNLNEAHTEYRVDRGGRKGGNGGDQRGRGEGRRGDGEERGGGRRFQ